MEYAHLHSRHLSVIFKFADIHKKRRSETRAAMNARFAAGREIVFSNAEGVAFDNEIAPYP